MINKISSRIILNVISIFIVIFLCYAMGKWIIPFFIGFILAYALHIPSKTISTKFNINSSLSAGIIVLFLIAIFTFVTLFFIPLLKNALILILQKLPNIITTMPRSINESINDMFKSLGFHNTHIDIINTFEQYLTSMTNSIPDHIIGFLNTGITLVYTIIFTIMTPIITFYLLKDWNKIEMYFSFIINKFASKSVVETLRIINKNLGSYIKGQLSVCVVLSIIYAISIYFIGTNEFIICGIFSGFLSFAPFFGPFLGFLLTLTISIDDFTSIYQYIFLFGIFMIVPFVDSNFITPKLIGKKTGIQPFWMLFSICATVSITGTYGIFIAIPIAVILSTIFKEMFRKLS